MSKRYKRNINSLVPFVKLTPFLALRERLREGYGLDNFKADVMSGLVVAIVAIPLGMALAIASGVPPQYGLYTVIIGGGIVALLGGSRFQVTGPTAAFVVILAPIAHKFGLGGLLVAGLMAGIMLLGMGLVRMGRLIQFIPYPVTTGFTTGIAVVILTLQLKDFFGLQVAEMPERFIEKVLALFRARGSASFIEFAIGAGTLFILIFWRKINKKIPAPLVALTIASVVTAVINNLFSSLHIATIGSRFTYNLRGVIGHGIPQALPHLDWPWRYFAPGEQIFKLTLESFESLLASAFAIAMLGAIESLLSAVVADGMAQTKHDPDAELVALGMGNILCPFFGGIAATGAIARTATNIRYGASSPLSSVLHAFFTLVIVLLFAPYVSYLPMAGLAALLMLVAYNMSEMHHFFHILRVAPKSDVVVLLLCFFLTVVFDMVIGVTVGVVLASLLFMRRMASISSVQAYTGSSHPHLVDSLPKEILLYGIAGPLFFGAAENAAEALDDITDGIKAVIFSLEDVPAMDVTGMVALESAINKLTTQNRYVYLVGVQPQPQKLFDRGDLFQKNKRVFICKDVAEGIRRAKETLAST
ncbi:MAG: C4-dicarboxylic acid transporter DauA [Bdellovibrionales bacterium GWA2_49_15]|nr:MAG: C4-dicarboxylic acid transporter DauA [Bdellovibrionales bacterium GWA2_49_15]HAZ12161.1 C4-dicarboxylic acid transporter DauA [Bdellovibrionales bacterium]